MKKGVAKQQPRRRGLLNSNQLMRTDSAEKEEGGC